MSTRVIAIDGPAASGKSSTGEAVARALGWSHLDTGSLYRGVTRVALDEGELDAADRILLAADRRGLGLEARDGRVVVLLDGEPADERLRGPEVAAAVSRVAALPEVRQWANVLFREAVNRSGAMVLDGRDIGTAVYPEAPLKIFLTATPEARAGRRLLEGGAPPTAARVAEEAARLAARDHADSTRVVAPLRRAVDAVEVDTTTLTLPEQVEQILTLARQIWLP